LDGSGYAKHTGKSIVKQCECLLKVITALAILFAVHSAYAELPDSVNVALKNSGVSPSQVSIFVQPLAAQPSLLEPPLISHQADIALNPASSMKIVTSYAGLRMLGPDYRWKTEAYADGKIINGVLYGNLYFKGYGDPNFSQTDFWQLLHQLRQQGLKEIKGDVLIDQSYFASQSPNTGSFDGEPLRAYNATPSAFIVNGKTSSFRFDATAMDVTVQVQPQLAEMKIVNELEVSAIDCAAWRNDLGYDINKEGQTTTVIFSGSFPANCDEKYLELLALTEHDYHLSLFRKLWAEAGGIFNGKLQVKVLPGDALKLAQHESKPLAQLLPEVNKWSNNLMAKQLLLTIAAETHSQSATEMNAVTAIKNWLASTGLPFNELSIENGSGLSRIERISTAHLGALLVHAYYSPVMPELMASLPILGVDGTMQKRKNSLAHAQGHFKTGSINQVYSVAGYMLAKNGQRYVVVFMVNDAKAALTRAAQDALLEWVYLH
jgi:D-alanyl-D-alanine carboxypeptidase/D-alanyl-D-alanine-endopeptidase (penicillin-binding protein 4)